MFLFTNFFTLAKPSLLLFAFFSHLFHDMVILYFNLICFITQIKNNNSFSAFFYLWFFFYSWMNFYFLALFRFGAFSSFNHNSIYFLYKNVLDFLYWFLKFFAFGFYCCFYYDFFCSIFPFTSFILSTSLFFFVVLLRPFFRIICFLRLIFLIL